MSLEIIQIIEDDRTQARLIDQALRQASFRTNVAHDGPAGMQDIWRNKPALVLLDVMLPGMDGMEVCRRLRKDPQTKHVPIIMITAMGSEEQRIAGLDEGADDYIAKPFSAKELAARVKAVLRRSQRNLQELDEEEDLVLEGQLFVVTFRGRRLTLSDLEWRALRRLATSRGKVVPREELRTLLWGNDELIHERDLNGCMESLKQKLDGPPSVGTILSLSGGGYQLTVPPIDSERAATSAPLATPPAA